MGPKITPTIDSFREDSVDRLVNVSSTCQIEKATKLMGSVREKSRSSYLFCRAKPKSNICLLYKYADITFWLCAAVLMSIM